MWFISKLPCNSLGNKALSLFFKLAHDKNLVNSDKWRGFGAILLVEFVLFPKGSEEFENAIFGTENGGLLRKNAKSAFFYNG